MRIIDHYRILIPHRCNHPLRWWFLSLLLASFPSMLPLHSKSYLLHARSGWRIFLTLPKFNRTNRSPLPANPEPLSPGAGWGFDFQNLPSTHVEEPPTAPVIPASLSSKSKQALSSVSGVSGSSKYTTPSQTATHTTGTRSRNRGPPSVTSSDEEVSSDLSSDNNSLSTPPAQAGRFLTPIYGPIGLPPAAPGTGRTAPLSLPTQTPGTGRMNAVNLPSTQQSQNPDGMPLPGATNEPPTPTTTTSTRGRGTGNRGKKRR